MLLKKVFLGVSLASLAGLAQAQSMDCDYFSGAYVGINGTYQSTNDKYTINNVTVPDMAGKQNIDIYAGHDGWGGGLFAGYGRLMDRTYLGAEIYGNATVGKQKLVSIEDDAYVAMKSPYSYGVVAKVGYLVSPQALVYVGLGAENSRFKLLQTTEAGDQDLLDTHKWGFVPKVGMKLAVNCNWQIGAEMSYASYRSIDIAKLSEFSDEAGGATISPRRATFGLNVTYHFV
jgi:opacity protein-like surface antigen